jgi:hypothetical protein
LRDEKNFRPEQAREGKKKKADAKWALHDQQVQ